jgi:hypothetical protein
LHRNNWEHLIIQKWNDFVTLYYFYFLF